MLPGLSTGGAAGACHARLASHVSSMLTDVGRVRAGVPKVGVTVKDVRHTAMTKMSATNAGNVGSRSRRERCLATGVVRNHLHRALAIRSPSVYMGAATPMKSSPIACVMGERYTASLSASDRSRRQTSLLSFSSPFRSRVSWLCRDTSSTDASLAAARLIFWF